jgi:hypothetical protein
VAVDGLGNLYIADTENSVIRAVNTQTTAITVAGVKIQPGDIETIAGNGKFGYNGDSGPASKAQLNGPVGIALDGSGNLFIADVGNNVIRRVDGSTGVITTVAGNGTAGYSGDGGAATNAELSLGCYSVGLCPPGSVTVDGSGNLSIADTSNNRVRRVSSATGIITTVVGGGSGGDGGPATAAQLLLSTNPLGGGTSVGVDASNNLFISDAGDSRVRRVDAVTGIISTVAEAEPLFGIAVDSAGDVYFANQWGTYRVDAVTGTVTTVAEVSGYDVAIDTSGNLFIGGSSSEVFRVAAATGLVTPAAGNGTQGYSGDGGPATSAELGPAVTVAVDRLGNLYIADSYYSVIRAVNTQATAITVAGVKIQPGDIATVAGGGQSFPGDGGPATSASLSVARGVAVSTLGNLFIADAFDARIRRVDGATGIITTVAGNGTWGFTGDGGPATNAELRLPSILAVDNSGHLYFPDSGNNRVREVDLPPNVALSPTSLSFGNQQVGSTSSPQRLALTNTDDGVLRIASIAASGDFSQTNTCGGSVLAGRSCTINVTFTPTATGTRTGTLTITDNDNGVAGSTQTVNLTGTGTPAAPVAGVSPASLTFGNQLLGTPSASQRVTLSNTGMATLTITSITASGDFSQTNNCRGSVAPSASCTINVTFTPTATGTRTGTLTITDNNNGVAGSTQTVSLTGTGVNPVPTLSKLSPSSATAGGSAFTLTVKGTNFVSSSVVHWKGTGLKTKYVSGTQLTASVPASDIATAGTATVTVVNPTPGGGTSGGLTFTINNPKPSATSLSPSSAKAGGAAFTLTVTGTNFVSSSTVQWNGTGLTTKYVSGTQLNPSVPASDIARAGKATVTVMNPTPGGGTSNGLTFTIK